MGRTNVLAIAATGLVAFSGGRALQRGDRPTEEAGRAPGGNSRLPPGAQPTQGAAPPSLAAPAARPGDPEAPSHPPSRQAPPCDPTRPLFQLAADFPATVRRHDCTLAIEEGQPALHVVLATLVNPLVAGFSSDFDRAVESIERAAQSRSYVLQRHWFPWEDRHLAEGRGRPGWLVFRRAAGHGEELLLVLIVGEHPSTGIDTPELETALYDAAGILPYAAGGGPLLVLGPYFSGTAVSLTQQLSIWCATADVKDRPLCKGRALVAVSGSVTLPKTQGVFQDLGAGAVFASSEFQATVLPDELLRVGMRRFLNEQLGDGQDEVADLTEASTEYGVESAASRASAPSPDAGAADDAASEKAASGDRAAAVKDSPRDPIDIGPRIPFPMHVGILAAEADKKQPEDTNVGEELPSVFDHQAAAKIRLQLDNTFAALSRYGIRHVGIVASSTQDKIFLVEQFRKSAPNLRVHVYESSIDLADRSKRDGLEGVMVASSYPLFPMTQAWARGPRQLQPFPSMEAEGVYNALLALLSRSVVARDKSADAGMLDYQPLTGGGQASGPSAWISVSLGNRLWPLATYSPAELTNPRGALPDGRPRGHQGAGSSRARLCAFIFPAAHAPVRCPGLAEQTATFEPPDGTAAPTTTGPPPRDVHVGFIAMVGAVMVFLLTLGNIVGFAVRKQRNAWWRFPLLSYAMPLDELSLPEGPEGHDGHERHHGHGAVTRRRVTLAGLWALGLTGAVMGTIIDLPVTFRDLATMAPAYYAFGVVLIVIAFVMVGAHLVTTARRRDIKNRSIVIGVQVMFIVLMALLVPTILWVPGRRDGHVFFFFLRAVDTGIGLTPTLPLFIVGMTIYVAALLQLSVLRCAATLHEHARGWDVDPPQPGTANKARTKSFSECANAMRAFSRDASRSVLIVCVLGTLGGFLLLFWSPLRLGSFEGRLFDAACSGGFALVFTVTVSTACRAHGLWLRLQAFTRALAIHPASAALERLPESVAQRFRSPVPGKLAADHIHIALAMNLHALGLSAPPHVDALRRELDGRWFPAGQPPAESPVAGGPVSAPDERLARVGGPAAARSALPALVAAPADDPLDELRARLKEDFLALKMAEVLSLMCDATRRMLLIATVSGTAALFGYAIYPFQPAAALTMIGLISDGLVALVALRVLLGIERDHVLSQLAKTPGGEITPSLGLVTRLVGYVIVPLGGLVGSRLQNPGAVIALFQDAAKMLNR